MKPFKSILSVLAFLVAIVSAFASDVFVDFARGKKPDGTCVVGVLQHPAEKCLTPSTATRCAVKIVDQGFTVLVPAFSLTGTCDSGQELYLQQ